MADLTCGAQLGGGRAGDGERARSTAVLPARLSGRGVPLPRGRGARRRRARRAPALRRGRREARGCVASARAAPEKKRAPGAVITDLSRWYVGVDGAPEAAACAARRATLVAFAERAAPPRLPLSLALSLSLSLGLSLLGAHLFWERVTRGPRSSALSLSPSTLRRRPGRSRSIDSMEASSIFWRNRAVAIVVVVVALR